jgi:hypothetical protein
MSEMDDDGIVQRLRQADLPVTRENYIKTNWTPDIMPDPWTAEYEAELPEELQDYDRFPDLKP